MSSLQRIRFEATERLVFPSMSTPGLRHGVFTRHGGESLGGYATLNVSLHVGDRPESVYSNRARIQRAMEMDHLISCRQVHGDRIIQVADYPPGNQELDACDALITSLPGVLLMVQQADCQAVFLFDPVQRAVGLAHAGWRGSVCGILPKTVSAMHDAFGSDPGHMRAAISPSLGSCCAEFKNFPQELPPDFHRYQVRPDYFDFWAISRDQLKACGLAADNICQSHICTRCSPDLFSYRRDKVSGRFASVIGVV